MMQHTMYMDFEVNNIRLCDIFK